MLTPPIGKQATYDFYGWDPAKYLMPDFHPRFAWETMMKQAAFPLPLEIAGMPGIYAHSARMHQKLVPHAEQTFQAIHAAGLWDSMAQWGGAYNFRVKRNGTSLSLHALGAAFDVDPIGNPMREGIVTDLLLRGALRGLTLCAEMEALQAKGVKLPFKMNLALIRLLVNLGWTWGGEFDDPMHFQFAHGV